MNEKKIEKIPDDWEKSYTKEIGKTVRYYRQNYINKEGLNLKLGLTAEELSKKISKLGYSLTSTAILDLERGRKKTIKITELIVIAGALNISPALLMVPKVSGKSITTFSMDDFLKEIKIFPNTSINYANAAAWAIGEKSGIDLITNNRQTQESIESIENIKAANKQIYDVLETKNPENKEELHYFVQEAVQETLKKNLSFNRKFIENLLSNDEELDTEMTTGEISKILKKRSDEAKKRIKNRNKNA